MSSNYPAGVTDAHPHFNPAETAQDVSCTNDEALVVPSFAIKAVLHELYEMAGGNYQGDNGLHRPANHGTIVQRIKELQDQIDTLEKDGTYECEWEGEVDLDISERAQWVCPRCGNDNEDDTTNEEDPDDAWERRRESYLD